MTKKRSDEMKRAFALWKKVTGVNPDARSQTLGSWEIAATFESVREAIDLDPTEITATLLLTHFVNSYVAETEVPIADVLRMDPKLAARIDACRELYGLLERQEMVEIRNAFSRAIAAALRHYGVDHRDDVKALLAAPDRVAILRRDALRSIKNLKIDQFLEGEPSPPSDRIVYNEAVHQWWNVNSLLAASTRMPPGIAVNLIRTPNDFEAFFAFSVRNGGSLFVLSDVPEYSHPLQGKMSRRPDREMDQRMARNWFPYDLLGVAYDEEAGRLYFKEAEGTAVAPYQGEATVVSRIADLPANELVWLIMMFDLIKERFWRIGFKAKELSYTAEMLKADGVLIDAAKTANLPVAAYSPVALAPLTIDDVRADALPEGAVGRMGHGKNRWMEERYIDRIDPETVNLIAPAEVEHSVTDGAITRGTGRDERMMSVWDRERERPATKLEKISSGAFGSRKTLAEDRLFVARFNVAGQVDRMAKDEFEDRKKEVSDWYRARIEANKENLIAWAANEEMWVSDGEGGTFSSWHNHVGPARRVDGDGGVKRPGEKSRLFRSLVRHYDIGNDRFGARGGFFLPMSRGHDEQKCAIKGVKPSHYVVLYPGNAKELALFAGCGVEDLPDVLRHFDLREPYSGNSILERIDPMEWRARNPWKEMDLRIRIAFSKRGLAEAKQRKAWPDFAGLERTVQDGIKFGGSIKF